LIADPQPVVRADERRVGSLQFGYGDAGKPGNAGPAIAPLNHVIIAAGRRIRALSQHVSGEEHQAEKKAQAEKRSERMCVIGGHAHVALLAKIRK
jgi:hypothetical protein